MEDRVPCEAEGRSALVTGTLYNSQYQLLCGLRGDKICMLKEHTDTKSADATLGSLLQNLS